MTDFKTHVLKIARSTNSYASFYSIRSFLSILSIGSAGSILSIGSRGSILSIGGLGLLQDKQRDDHSGDQKKESM